MPPETSSTVTSVPWWLASILIPLFVHLIYFGLAVLVFMMRRSVGWGIRNVSQQDMASIYGNVFIQELPRIGPETCKIALAVILGAVALGESMLEGSLISKYGLWVGILAVPIWVVCLAFSVFLCNTCESHVPGEGSLRIRPWLRWGFTCICSIAFGVIPFMATCWMLKGGGSG